MQCPACNAAFRMHERNCPVCDADVGYPNVRAVLAPDEVAALAERVDQASKSCAQRDCTDAFERFRQRVGESRAVLCRSLSQVMTLVSSDNELYATFYGQVSAHSRRPEETVVEQERLVADSLLFPFYKDEIRFAALSINGEGVAKYGTCSLVLKDAAIRHRATTFEKNSLEFCRERKLGVGSPVPPGYRAGWKDRQALAAAKLHESLEQNTDPVSFADLLLNNATGDFVEVHIFGPIHRGAVETINMAELSRRSDEALFIEIERRAQEFGATVRQKKNA
jgi:hypothetical protein